MKDFFNSANMFKIHLPKNEIVDGLELQNNGKWVPYQKWHQVRDELGRNLLYISIDILEHIDELKFSYRNPEVVNTIHIQFRPNTGANHDYSIMWMSGTEFVLVYNKDIDDNKFIFFYTSNKAYNIIKYLSEYDQHNNNIMMNKRFGYNKHYPFVILQDKEAYIKTLFEEVSNTYRFKEYDINQNYMFAGPAWLIAIYTSTKPYTNEPTFKMVKLLVNNSITLMTIDGPFIYINPSHYDMMHYILEENYKMSKDSSGYCEIEDKEKLCD